MHNSPILADWGTPNWVLFIAQLLPKLAKLHIRQAIRTQASGNFVRTTNANTPPRAHSALKMDKDVHFVLAY